MVKTMLNLQTFKVEVKSTKNGGLYIKVGDSKVPYDVSSNLDYMEQAKRFVESSGLTVLGCDFTTIVVTSRAVKVTELFKFQELSEKAQEKVISDYERDSYFIDDFILDSLTELLENFGFYETDIEYSFDYSHVPFAKFSGKFKKPDSETLESMLTEFGDLEIQRIVSLIKSLPNDCELYNVKSQSDYDSEGETPIDAFYIELINKMICAVNEYLLKMLQTECDYLQSRDFIIEDIMSNDYTFDVDGNFISTK